MPDKETIEAAEEDKREGKAATTQAGEFVREEMHHIREGKHGARNTKQAIAIGLSKARRAGVDVKASKDASPSVKKKASQELAKGRAKKKAAPSKTRSRATTKALKREGRAAASKQALSRQAKSVARKRSNSRSKG